MALAVSTKAKIAAATLTAATLIGGAFSANAQQMARTNELDYSACDQLAITAPAKAAQCRIDVIKASAAAAQRRIQVADRDGDCADQLKALRMKDPSVVERGRAILAGRPLAQYGVCNLVDELTRR